MEKILNYILSAADDAGLSSREICRRAGLAPYTLQNIRKGRDPRLSTLQKLVNALEVELTVRIEPDAPAILPETPATQLERVD